jgi:iron(III) transport system ATP-binding protein
MGGAELRCATTDKLRPGAPVTLAIRPEEIVVGPAARAGENRLATRIRGVQFLGPFTRLSLAVPASETTLECDVAATAFADLGVAEGAELALALRPEALRVFAGDD